MPGTTAKVLSAALAAAAVSVIAIPAVEACTRAVYLGSDGLVITGRTMDWIEDMKSNMWIFPRGMQRDGAAGANSVKWTSKYGSATIASYDAASTDGMNEKGLVANLLYLAKSDFGKPDGGKSTLSVTSWAQYVLDNYATVAEAVDALGKDPLSMVAPTLPNGAPANLHLSISDASGDSAVFEYVDAKLSVHHGKELQVMTNEPPMDQQAALNAYWKNIGGQTFLPGTIKPEDRFVRASYFINAIPKTIEPALIKSVPDASLPNQAAASVLSVMRTVSTPFGLHTPGEPNNSSTLWRTVADQKDLVYFFDSATSPNAFWVDFADLDFKEGAPVKKLTMAGGKVYAGNVAAKLEPAKPYKFLEATPSS
jgi:penicillin V acylase-like amidase (Ntn superfamily)